MKTFFAWDRAAVLWMIARAGKRAGLVALWFLVLAFVSLGIRELISLMVYWLTSSPR